MFTRFIAACRFLLILPVIGSLALGAGVLAFAAGRVGYTLLGLAKGMEFTGAAGKKLSLAAIEIVDLFLIGTVAYITAVGIYTLFINPEAKLPVRLGIDHLDDLKEKIIGVLVLALGVLFLGQAVSWTAGQELLYLGGGIAAVIAALAYFLKHKSGHGDGTGHATDSGAVAQ